MKIAAFVLHEIFLLTGKEKISHNLVDGRIRYIVRISKCYRILYTNFFKSIRVDDLPAKRLFVETNDYAFLSHILTGDG